MRSSQVTVRLVRFAVRLVRFTVQLVRLVSTNQSNEPYNNQSGEHGSDNSQSDESYINQSYFSEMPRTFGGQPTGP